ncbi:CaiB/BaiF CoA transferase family protein [Geodermatophilus sp. SYSU D01105]
MADDVSTPALTGVRVLELGSIIAGPFCGRLLADHGADVIKIEAPGAPDPLREWGQAEQDGHHFFWTVHARNKRCITLDLHRPEGQEIFLRLIDTADVLVESFRPGTLEKWGLDPEVLGARNPGLVLARVSGYGQTGPDSRRPGYASVAEAVSGMRYLNGYPGGPPPRPALSIGDSLAGMFAAQGVLMALLARERGRCTGQVVDVALTESCLALLESSIPDYDRGGVVREPSGTRLTGIAPSNLYESADGRWMVIAANQDTVFSRLCAAMDRPELVTDPRFRSHTARGRHQDEIDDIVADWARRHDAATLTRVLEDAGVVVGPVNTVAEVVEDPQFRAREMLVPHFDEAIGADVLGPGVVPKLTGTPGSVRWAGAPHPGAHNAEVYGGLLGLSAPQLHDLEAAGVI